MSDRSNERAAIAFPHGDRVHCEFALCLADLTRWDAHNSGRLNHPGWRISSENSGNVAVARNHIVRTFLEGTDADWLWFIDTDESFNPDTLERLIQSADPVQRPIVSGLVFAQAHNRMLPVSPVPVVFDEEVQDFREVMMLPTERHWRVASAGCGCLLIHRSVLEAVGEAHKDDAFPWFKWAQHNRNGKPDVMSEDFTFSLRASALGFPVVVDTTIECGHVKRHVLTSQSYWQQVPPELRPRQTAAVVPVKDRFALTSEIVRQLQDQVDQVIVVDNGSGKKTRNWLDSQDVTVLDAPGEGIHVMWNMGADAAARLGPFVDVLFVNNDVSLGDGCVEKLADALRSARDLAVVCPNYDGRRRRLTSGLGDEWIEYRTDICADRYDGTGGIAGFCFMVRSEFLARYRFPTECKWWFGDNDLLLAVQHSGLNSAIVVEASCEHIDGGGKTGDWESPEMRAQIAADRDAFMARWAAPQSVGGGDASSGTVPPPTEPIGADR